MLTTVNEILLNATDSLVHLVEAKQCLDKILPSSEHVLKARCFLLGKSSIIADFFANSVAELEESFWFWQCCSKPFLLTPVATEFIDAAFCPVMARAMLGHFDGHREDSSKIIKFFKNALSPLDFEQRFKSSLFRILSFVVLYYHELDAPDDGMVFGSRLISFSVPSMLCAHLLNRQAGS